MKFERSSGILLHPTSLPGPGGIGTLGKEAFWFVDLLAEMKQKLWQVLPLYPTGFGDSPYQALSAFAGNPLFISLEKLHEEGLLEKKDMDTAKKFPAEFVDFSLVRSNRNLLFRKAFKNFMNYAGTEELKELEAFIKQNSEWLNDFVLFMAVKEYQNLKSWNEWDKGIRLRQSGAISKFRGLLKDDIKYHCFLQFYFFRQWNALKEYATKKGIKIIGDNPIYMAYDSADVWSHSELFELDKNHVPTKVAGVPPDNFSETGQLWGCPIYNWKKHKETGYAWWIKNLSASFAMTDFVRIDHFIGFERYWAIPYGEKTAINGKWEKGPGLGFFKTLRKTLGDIPMIAEDLGVMTKGVTKIKDQMGFPGMKLLQEAFNGNPDHPFLPHNYSEAYIAYTGTHDNDTCLGAYRKMPAAHKRFMKEYLNISLRSREIVWHLIRAAWSSDACMAIIPMQDLLGLGSEARMNTPGTLCNNWKWRFKKEMLNEKHSSRLKQLTEQYNR
jgi:4-alpha-glucanotransferase